MKYQELFEAYLGALAARRCAPGTRAGAISVLPRFFAHLKRARVRDPRRVSEAHVVSFARLLSQPKNGRSLSVATQANYLSVVKAFCAFLEKRGFLLCDPAAQLRLPVRLRLPRALNRTQARRVICAPDRTGVLALRDRALLELLYGTGVRMMECVRLDLSDVNLRDGILLVRDGKGRKDRYVPISGRALEALDVYLKDCRPELLRGHEPALFLTRRGARLSAMSVRVRVRRYGERVGVKVSCHVLRHSYATHLLQGGANVREIQKLLGHKRLGTTALYTKIDARGLAAMLRRSHPRERYGLCRRKPI
jgi:site-specific recombinase XerD